ncbi:MAG: hypothetical protein ACI4RT_06465 [Candidatus Spyradenecus sp.]
MNSWKQTLQLAIGLTVTALVGLAHAAEVKLSETTELQAGGDLTHTFAAGDTFVVDIAFTPTSFEPTCSGDFTMKVVSGGSVANTTALNFSGVTGALTLSGLGTSEARLLAPTFASGKTVNLESCWFSALALTTSSVVNMTYNVSGTGALGSLTASDGKYATLNLSDTQEITTITSPYQAGKELLTVKVNKGASVTVTGDYDAGCSNLTVNGLMTCKGNFKTDRKNYQNTSVIIPEGGQLVVEKDFLLGNGGSPNPYLYINGGEVKVRGAFIRNCSNQPRGTVSIASGLLQVGTLQDKNTTNGLPFGNQQNKVTTCLLTGGMLDVLNGTWTSTAATFHTKGTTVKVGADVSMGIAWVLEADTPLIVAEGKTLTFTNTITSDGVALDLSENQGTVALGSNRPQLKGVGGSIKVSPSVDEVVARQVPLSVTDAVTSIEGTTWQVEGWETVNATLDTSAKQVILSQAGSMPTRVLSGDGAWNETGWEGCETAPTSGSAEVKTEVDATLTIGATVALDALYFDVGAGKTLTVAIAAQDASLVVSQTIVKSGTVIVQGGSYGQVSLASDAALLFGQGATFTSVDDGGTIGLSGSGTKEVDDSKALLFRAGTFRKEGEGEFKVQFDSSADAWCNRVEVKSGGLNVWQVNSKDRSYTFNLSIDRGAQFTQGATWGNSVNLKGSLAGEGTLNIPNHTGSTNADTTRSFTFSGACADFTGKAQATGVAVYLEPSDSHFGGSLSVETAGSRVVTFSVADGVTIGGDVTLGTSGKTMTLSLKGTAPKAKSLTLKGLVTVSLPEASIADGTVLFTLTGEGAKADTETAEKFTSVPSGYVVVAEGASYVLRKVTLPGVEPSVPGAGDEQAYSDEAAAALTAAAGEAGLQEVSTILLQTKGAASGSKPTVTEVNNALGCFAGVVEADAGEKTLTIRYEFGVADIGPDLTALDEAGDWAGKWQVVAKVEGPEGAVFVDGVTVSAYEVGEDGIIAADAEPLSSTTVSGAVNEVTLRGITLEGLGTHGVRVKVKAEK